MVNEVKKNRRAWSGRKGLVITSLVAFAIGFTPAMAMGGAVSSESNPITGGKVYRSYAWVLNGSSNAYAQGSAHMGPGSGYSLPSGWAGARGRLFSSGGSLLCEGTTGYSSSTMSYPSTYNNYSCIRYDAGTRYGYGVVYAWNGNGYNIYYTFRTPNQTNT